MWIICQCKKSKKRKGRFATVTTAMLEDKAKLCNQVPNKFADVSCLLCCCLIPILQVGHTYGHFWGWTDTQNCCLIPIQNAEGRRDWAPIGYSLYSGLAPSSLMPQVEGVYKRWCKNKERHLLGDIPSYRRDVFSPNKINSRPTGHRARICALKIVVKDSLFVQRCFLIVGKLQMSERMGNFKAMTEERQTTCKKTAVRFIIDF